MNNSQCSLCLENKKIKIHFNCTKHSSLCAKCLGRKLLDNSVSITLIPNNIIKLKCKCDVILQLSENNLIDILCNEQDEHISNCTVHSSQENNFYCKNCAILFCKNCYENHKTHKLYSLSNLLENLNNIKNNIKYKTFNELKSFLSTKSKEIISKVTQYNNEQIKSIDEMIKLLQDYKIKIIEKTNEKIDKFSRYINIIQTIYSQFYYLITDINIKNINFSSLLYINKLKHISKIFFIEREDITNCLTEISICLERIINDNSPEFSFSFKKISKIKNTPQYKSPNEITTSFIKHKINNDNNNYLYYNTPQKQTPFLKCEQILHGHTGCIYNIIQLTNGKIASCSNDKRIIIWNDKTLEKEFTLIGHSQRVNCLTQLNIKTLISCSADYSIKVWDLNQKKIKFTLLGHNGNVSSLSILPNNCLASSSWDGSIKIWNLKEQKEKFTLHAKANSICSLVYINNDKLCSSIYKYIKIWNLETKKEEDTLSGHKKCVNCIVFLSENGIIASGADDKTIRVWELNSKMCLCVLSGHDQAIYCLMEYDSGNIISGSEDKSLRMWDIWGKKEKENMSAHSATIRAVVKLLDGRIISGAADGSIKIWKI